MEIIPNPEVAVECSLHCCFQPAMGRLSGVERLSITSLSGSLRLGEEAWAMQKHGY